MDKVTTLMLIGATLAVAVFAGWRGGRAWDPARGVRMVPWRFIMMVAGAVVFYLLVHLAVLFGAPQRPI